jgi:hypothetical protein
MQGHIKVTPHLEINYSYFRVNGNKVIIVATPRKLFASKSYMDLDAKREVSQK